MQVNNYKQFKYQNQTRFNINLSIKAKSNSSEILKQNNLVKRPLTIIYNILKIN